MQEIPPAVSIETAVRVQIFADTGKYKQMLYGKRGTFISHSKRTLLGYMGIIMIIAAILVFTCIVIIIMQARVQVSDSIPKQNSDPPPTAWNDSNVTSQMI